jgi:ABC-type Fe3+-hydroxamate transport system substrate-binding protein
MRVVSLLPSATETLCLIGGERMLVGRSHECDHPASITDRPTLTSQRTVFASAGEVDRAVSESLASGQSLYHLDGDRLRELRPDVILTQDLCPVCSVDLGEVREAASAMDPAPRVVALNPRSFEDVLDGLMEVGRAVGLEDGARTALVELRNRFFSAADYANPFTLPPPVVFLEWTDPLYVGGHWTAQLVERAGGSHPLNPTVAMDDAGTGAGGQMAHRLAGASKRVTPEMVAAAAPEHLIVCPCGLDLHATRREVEALATQEWFASLPAVRTGRAALVDGSQMFNRPGPRLVDAYEWLVGWLNDIPSLIKEEFPWQSWR